MSWCGFDIQYSDKGRLSGKANKLYKKTQNRSQGKFPFVVNIGYELLLSPYSVKKTLVSFSVRRMNKTFISVKV